MSTSLALTALLVFSAAVFSTVALVLASEVFRDWVKRRQVAKRLEPVIAHVQETGEGASNELIRHFQSRGGTLADLAQSLPGVGRAEDLLREARVSWRPESLYLMSAGLAVGLGGATLLLTSQIVLAFPAAMFGAAMPFLYLMRTRTVRLRAFEEQFPESIDLLTRAIRAGHPLASGMRMVADEGPPAVADEFRQSFEEQRFGLPFADALLGMVDRVDLVDVRIFAIAVLIQREVGGNLAEILDNLAQTIRGRFYIRRQLRVYTAQGRLSGYALAALPVFVGGFTFLIQREYMMLLFTTQIGKLLVFTAILLQFFGVLWIRKIINIDI